MMYNYDERIKELKELAYLDESADYETDITGIYYDEASKKYSLITASGCSCWDGDYSEEQFNSLDEIATSLFRDDREFNPTFSGNKTLLEEARKNDKSR